MKKRLLALLLALSMTAALAACGSKEEPTPETEEPQVEEPAAPETEEPAEGEETETPEAPETEEPAEQPEEKPAETPEVKPEAEKPTEKPAEKPAEKPGSSVNLTDFYGQLEQLMIDTLGEENSPAMMVMDADMMAAQYPGLAELNPKQAVIAGPMMGAVVAEFALAEAQNADEAAKIAEVFKARIGYMVGDEQNPGAAWYPASIEGWKLNAKVVTNGSYVMLVAIEGNQTYIDAFNALFA